MPKRQSRYSKDALLTEVELEVPELGNPQITADVVQFQFVLGGLPPTFQPTETADPPRTTGWVDGYWLTLSTGMVVAGVNVGPAGDVVLAPGIYAAWVRVVDNPLVPVEAFDTLEIY